MKINENKQIEFEDGDLMGIIVKIPKTIFKMEVICHVIDDNDEVQKMHGKFTLDDIMSLRKDFLENVECGDEYDATYVITDEGKEWLESRKTRATNE